MKNRYPISKLHFPGAIRHFFWYLSHYFIIQDKHAAFLISFLFSNIFPLSSNFDCAYYIFPDDIFGRFPDTRRLACLNNLFLSHAQATVHLKRHSRLESFFFKILRTFVHYPLISNFVFEKSNTILISELKKKNLVFFSFFLLSSTEILGSDLYHYHS